MKNKTPHPERYFYIVLLCFVLLIGNYYRTDSWTGDKPFSAFLARDWQLFAVFMIEEIILVGVMILFWKLWLKSCRKLDFPFLEKWEADQYLGIKPGDYDYVWFDFSYSERALIWKEGNHFTLSVQAYEENTRNWGNVGGVSIYDSLEAVKKALFYECDFHCEENTEFDKHGYEVYKET